MAIALQIKRGVAANIPSLVVGEFYFATDTQILYVGTASGNLIVGPSASSGGGQGTGLLDFGAFPGATDTILVVTGQTSILAGSLVEAWVLPVATADHAADEHWADPPDVFAGNIVAGTGFTIYGRIRLQSLNASSDLSCLSPQIYGKWNIAWRWK